MEERKLRIKRLTKSFGSLTVFQNLSMEFAHKKINVILGESGCGKSTLLKIIAGDTETISEEILFPKEKSFIFQEDVLIPWKTVYENVVFPSIGKFSNSDLREKAEEIIEKLGLKDFMNFYPSQLSGGMKKRVGIARAFMYPAELILMDEPFNGLDIKRLEAVVQDFLQMQKKSPKTVILVTHDIDTAVLLGEHFFIFSGKPANVRCQLDYENFKDRESLKRKIQEILKEKNR